MPEPMKRAPAMNSFLDDLASIAFGTPDREGSIKAGICIKCHGEAKEFKSDVARQEFPISGFCQTCQDIAFTPMEEDEV